MCYDVNFIFKQQLKRAKYHDNKEAINEIEKQIIEHFPKQMHYVSGFSHPEMLIYTQEDPFMPVLSKWGFVPFWCKDTEQADKLSNMCLNAVGETIFDKPSFRKSAIEKRGIVYLNGFFDHHHYNNKSYPFYISAIDDEPLVIATLYDEWTNQETGEVIHTFSIITSEANSMMAKIHNKKKRMPLILDQHQIEIWLESKLNDVKETISKIITPYPQEKLNAYPVGRLKGSNAIGNIPEATLQAKYNELWNSEIAYLLD